MHLYEVWELSMETIVEYCKVSFLHAICQKLTFVML